MIGWFYITAHVFIILIVLLLFFYLFPFVSYFEYIKRKMRDISKTYRNDKSYKLFDMSDVYLIWHSFFKNWLGCICNPITLGRKRQNEQSFEVWELFQRRKKHFWHLKSWKFGGEYQVQGQYTIMCIHKQCWI